MSTQTPSGKWWSRDSAAQPGDDEDLTARAAKLVRASAAAESLRIAAEQAAAEQAAERLVAEESAAQHATARAKCEHFYKCSCKSTAMYR
ncbi:hypothetical protein NBCG_03423 [Nocardioidaceae bacterium Broad-1]|nr:hypothetical protein NBCG_03423 [Nocardioidaceae bacterium Broad-1]